MANPEVKYATISEISARSLYKILKLRSDVFVVEQNCPYSDMDGRDLEPDALHVWIDDDGEALAVIRILREQDGTARVGRVCTAERGRGRGLAKQLMNFAVTATTGDIVLNGQSYLRAWYESLGYVVDGEEFLEVGTPHFPMRLVRARP